ncbi:MAG: tRNA (adenosine(37)-N6)-threonylcarbamoyltransferase complex ATPase subunit type 1 TsaE [Actinomycetes bacterium]
MEFPVDVKTSSALETEVLGSELAGCFVAGDRVILEGDLGSGKTALVRGICRGLGITDDVTSPTFTLAQRYEEGRVPVSHLDLYRLEPGMAGEDPGVLEGEFSTGRLTLVEWPERAPVGALQPTYRVSIEHLGGDDRQVLVECLS